MRKNNRVSYIKGKATPPVQKDCKNFQRYKVASGKGTKYNPCRGKL